MKRLLPTLAFDKIDSTWFKRLINIYPPYLGSGARIKYVSADFKHLIVVMPLRWHNRNAMGKHFGGSLFSMTDPFYMLMLMRILGSTYIVWDKSASIDYILPGDGTVKAEFRLSDAQINEIRSKTESGEKYLPEFTVTVTDKKGRAVAEVHKTLYIKRKELNQ